VGVHVDPARHRGPHALDRDRFTDPGGVVVDQVALELLDLIVGQDHLRELADPSVDTVHDLMSFDLLLEHTAADVDTLDGLGMELYFFTIPGDAHQLFDGQSGPIQNDCHF